MRGTSKTPYKLVLAVLTLVGAWTAWTAFGGWHPSAYGGDAWVYLAAGERLNAGHALYALTVGDRPVDIVPPYWTVPLLAPPPVAVIWRLLAIVGDAAMVIWGIAALFAVGWAAWELRGPAVALLAAPLALTALSGNGSAFVLVALVLIWRWRDHGWRVGFLIAVAASLKLTPAVLVLWLLVTKRWRAVASVVLFGSAIAAASVVGAGIAAWREWLAAVPQSAPSPLAIAAITGLPTWSIVVLSGSAVLATRIVTTSDRATFAVAVVATTFATPAFYFQALALLAAADVWSGSRRAESALRTEATASVRLG